MTSKPKPPEQPAFVLDSVNEDLFAYGGTLENLRTTAHPPHSEPIPGPPVESTGIGPLGNRFTWYDPRRFEQLCLADDSVQQALHQLKRLRYSQAAIGAVHVAVSNVYTAYLVELVGHFDRRAAAIGNYFVAKRAWQELHKEVKSTSLPAATAPFQEPTDAPADSPGPSPPPSHQ